MNIKPTATNLFLQKQLTSSTSPGGLHLPDSARTSVYVVVYAGPDATLEAGTAVIPSAKASVKVAVGDEEYIVTTQEDLFATLEM